MQRKVHKHPNGGHFVYLPQSWFAQHLTTGWEGKEVKLTFGSKLLVEPHPSKPKTFNNYLVASRTPFRLPLGGGGTDLPEYYTKHEGFWISGTINHYINIILKNRFERQSKFVYSETQYVDEPSQFNHPILRAVLTKYSLIKHLELISVGDLPAHTGLGSSGTFTVGLLKAVHKFLSLEHSPQQLAEEAYEIERLTLGRKIGKQDQYTATFGGLRKYTITQTGEVSSEPLNTNISTFEKWLLLFYVNQRTTSISEEVTVMSESDRQKIQLIGTESFNTLQNNNFEQYGQLLHKHWMIKSRYQPLLFSSLINLATRHGAIGGKLCGAGGGGCIMLVCPPEKQQKVIEELEKKNTTNIPFNFEPFGSEVY